MADKSPRKPSDKKPGKTLKEKRTAKKLKLKRRATPERLSRLDFAVLDS
jgi:hypothetical protein